MKNIFYKELNLQSTLIKLEGDHFHHFKNVLRGRVNDEVKVFNGMGLLGQGRVEDLGKREMSISLDEVEEKTPYSSSNLIIGIPKKEYLESIIRSAIQIGVSQISLVTTDYTPWKYKYYERLEKVMESTLIQCENPYLPSIKEYNSLGEALDEHEGSILAFSTEVSVFEGKDHGHNTSLLIGPEGGFSEREIELLRSHEKVELLKCAIPIMKAEVAVPFGLGLLYGKNK